MIVFQRAQSAQFAGQPGAFGVAFRGFGGIVVTTDSIATFSITDPSPRFLLTDPAPDFALSDPAPRFHLSLPGDA